MVAEIKCGYCLRVETHLFNKSDADTTERLKDVLVPPMRLMCTLSFAALLLPLKLWQGKKSQTNYPECNVSITWQKEKKDGKRLFSPCPPPTQFVHTLNWLPEFHLDFLSRNLQAGFLLWPGSSHIGLHNVSALCFCCCINRLASCAPTVKCRIYVHSKQMSSL